MKLWRYDPKTPEGKYPLVYQRDGSLLTSRYLVITLRDPCAPAAFLAYADAAERLGLDAAYVASMKALADEAVEEARKVGLGDPDAPPHRVDDPATLAKAREIGCPGA